MDNNNIFLSEPKLYDIFNKNCFEDINMYKNLCLTADNSILELGIGTGRIAIPLAKDGKHIVGVDNSPAMLEILQQKITNENINNIIFFQQDMCSLSLGGEFNLILCPFCTFNFLLSIEKQREALLSIRNLMNKKSKIIFDILTTNTFPSTLEDNSLKYFDSCEAYIDDVYFEIYISNSFDQSNQIFKQERYYREYKNGIFTKEYHTTMKNRFFLIGEFQLLLRECGYKILNIYGDYNFSSFSNISPNLIVEATLAI